MKKTEKTIREKALDLFLEHNGDITNRAIAKKLGANEKTVSVWKYRYKWKEELERSTKSKNKSTTQNVSVREKQRKRIIDALNIANSYSPALNILIDVYLDCYEEYEKAKAKDMETESLRKELARLLRDLGLDISNKKLTMKKVDKKKEENKPSTNKLVQFRQRMTE